MLPIELKYNIDTCDSSPRFPSEAIQNHQVWLSRLLQPHKPLNFKCTLCLGFMTAIQDTNIAE